MEGYPKRGIEPLLNWNVIAEALKERPGRWALIRTDVDDQNAWRINKGRNAAFRRRGQYEAVIRNRGKYAHREHGDLYARYIGPWDE